MVLTKDLLFRALVSGGSLLTTEVRFKIVIAIEREEGSTHAFIVTGIDERDRPSPDSFRLASAFTGSGTPFHPASF
jgi:hypothetical protein